MLDEACGLPSPTDMGGAWRVARKEPPAFVIDGWMVVGGKPVECHMPVVAAPPATYGVYAITAQGRRVACGVQGEADTPHSGAYAITKQGGRVARHV